MTPNADDSRSTLRSAAAVLAAACFAATAIIAAQPAPNIWDGVYSNSQAARGQETFDRFCTSCHGAALEGGEGPGLAGGEFLRNWLEDDLSSLFRRIHDRMPADSPGSLSADESRDLVAYLLYENGFPAGSRELPADPGALAAIRIHGKDGPGPVPEFSLVRVIGCLGQDSKRQWTLTRGTEPIRSHDAAASGNPSAVAAAVIGTQAFRLMDVAASRPEPHKGTKVEVKGLLMRPPDGAVLNVTSLQASGAACPE